MMRGLSMCRVNHAINTAANYCEGLDLMGAGLS
jgi:hypothetical protein